MTDNHPVYTYSVSPVAAVYSPWERRRDALDRALDYLRNEQGVVGAGTAEAVVQVAGVFDAFIAPRPATPAEETP